MSNPAHLIWQNETFLIYTNYNVPYTPTPISIKDCYLSTNWICYFYLQNKSKIQKKMYALSTLYDSGQPTTPQKEYEKEIWNQVFWNIFSIFKMKNFLCEETTLLCSNVWWYSLTNFLSRHKQPTLKKRVKSNRKWWRILQAKNYG